MSNPWIIAIINGAIVILAAVILSSIIRIGKYRSRQNERKKLLKQVKHLMEEQQYTDALTLLENNQLHFAKKTGERAMIQTYRGICLKNLAELQNDPENLRLAIRQFEEAIRIGSSKKTMVGFADIYNQLGSCYMALANHEQKETNLNKAKISFEKGLTSKPELPLYATLQYRLGIINQNLAGISSGERQLTYLIQAVEALHEATTVFTLKKNPLEYATVQLALSNSYLLLADHKDNVRNLELAISSARNALLIFTAKTKPENFGAAQYNLGSACLMLADQLNQPKYLLKAYRAFLSALRIYEPKDYPLEFAKTNQSLITLYQSVAYRLGTAKYLFRALQCSEVVSKIFSIERYPFSYASAQFHQGAIFYALAEYENPEYNLAKALAALEETLRVYSGNNHPEVYTETQIMRGQIFSKLADYKNSSEYLNQACVSFKSALKNQHFKSDAEQARTEMQLGNVYQRLAPLEDSRDNLNQALSAYTKAIQIYDSSAFPEEYTEALVNIGKSYLSLSRFIYWKDNLKLAAEALQSALTLINPAKDHQTAGLILNHLGETHYEMARHNGEVSDLEKSAAYYDQSLKEYGDGDTVLTASIYRNQGAVYKMLAQHKNSQSNLDQAAQAFQKALKTYTQETDSIDCADILLDLGDTLSELAEVNEKEYNLTKANSCFEKALKLVDSKTNPLQYARLNYLLGRNCMSLTNFGNTAIINQAIHALENTLSIYQADRYPDEYALSLNYLGVAYQNRAELTPKNPEIDLLNSIQSLKEVLKIYNVKKYPLDYAMVQNNLGTAYSLLAETQNRDQNLRLALKAFEEAAKIYRAESQPIHLKKVQSNLEKVQGRFRLDHLE